MRDIARTDCSMTIGTKSYALGSVHPDDAEVEVEVRETAEIG